MTPIWSNKYRPNNLSEYIFQNKSQKQKFEEYITTKTIPNLLLSGSCGTGKSSFARILVNSLIDPDNLHSDAKIINASKDNNAETVRTTISNFIESFPMGDFKIILLEEADYLSHSAQAILRPLTEDFTDSVRFIITCNYPNKILPALKSRFTHYHFDDMSTDDMMARLIEIVLEEKIEPNLEVLEECIDSSYPDMRQIITNVQNCVVDGKLVSKKIIQTKEWKDNISSGIKQSNWEKIYSCVNVDVPSNEFEEFYTMMYENIHMFNSFEKGTLKFDMAMILIAEHLFKHASFGQPHINAGALVLQLKHLEK